MLLVTDVQTGRKIVDLLPAQRKVMLIENGVAAGVAYDTYAAGKEGKETTGNALPAPNT